MKRANLWFAMANPADWLLRNLHSECGESKDSPSPTCLGRNTKLSQVEIETIDDLTWNWVNNLSRNTKLSQVEIETFRKSSIFCRDSSISS